jgi:hypothetical protein
MTDPAATSTGRHRRCKRPGLSCWGRAVITVGTRTYCQVHAADAWLQDAAEPDPHE